jgi:hypothetical protein
VGMYTILSLSALCEAVKARVLKFWVLKSQR